MGWYIFAAMGQYKYINLGRLGRGNVIFEVMAYEDEVTQLVNCICTISEKHPRFGTV